jgi:protein-S-isoprenylcysteine O-methyltransferase Ste14
MNVPAQVSANLSGLWKVLDWGWIASEVLILVLTRTRRSTGNVRDRGSLLILWPVIVASVSVGEWIGETHPPTMFGGAHWVRNLSVAILAAGLAIRWTAVATLGKRFSVNVAIYTSQTLHRTGLFRFVRHPSYTGLLLIFVAVGIHTRNWLGLAVVLVPTTAALLYRIHVEEAALNDAFGQEYRDYSRTTKRLIPGIY